MNSLVIGLDTYSGTARGLDLSSFDYRGGACCPDRGSELWHVLTLLGGLLISMHSMLKRKACSFNIRSSRNSVCFRWPVHGESGYAF
jgi:hypothetical protein